MRGVETVCLVLVTLMLISMAPANADMDNLGGLRLQDTRDNLPRTTAFTRGGQRNPATYDILHYDISITTQLDLHLLNGISAITIRIWEYTENLTFDLGLTTNNVSLSNGILLRHEHDLASFRLVVHSDGLFLIGTTVHLIVKYGGPVSEHAPKTDYIGPEGSWVQQPKFMYPAPHRENQNESHDWFTADINVTVPNGRAAVSNGELVSSRTPSIGNWTYYWRTLQPTVGLSFAEGNLRKTKTRHHAIDIETYLFPVHNTLASKYLDEMNKTIDFYNSTFHPYPYPKFAIVEIPLMFKYGAACLQSFAVVQTSVLDDFEPDEGPLPHELAHSWWGQMIVGHGSEASWLSESFASYSADLFREFLYGNRSTLEQQKLTYFQMESSSHETPVANGFSPYNKGPWILHMLRYILGNATFFQTLNQFVGHYALFQDVTIADFRHTAEVVSGEDLSWFFQQWVYGTEHLSLEVQSATSLQERDGSYLTEVKIHRTGGIVMPVDVSFATAQGKTITLEKYVNLTSVDTTTSFVSAVQITSIAFDSHGWLLANFPVTNVTFQPYQRPFFEEGLFWFSVVAVAFLVIAVFVLVRRRKREGTQLQP